MRNYLVQVVSSAIVDKYIGESARIIREMFGYAREHQPCVIFMDEVGAEQHVLKRGTCSCVWAPAPCRTRASTTCTASLAHMHEARHEGRCSCLGCLRCGSGPLGVRSLSMIDGNGTAHGRVAAVHSAGAR